MRPMLNQPSSEIGIPDGFMQKEWELKRNYPDFSDFITSRIAQEREKHNSGLLPDLDGIEDEIRRLSKRPQYNSGKARGKS
jgi:hypothetical protein